MVICKGGTYLETRAALNVYLPAFSYSFVSTSVRLTPGRSEVDLLTARVTTLSPSSGRATKISSLSFILLMQINAHLMHFRILTGRCFHQHPDAVSLPHPGERKKPKHNRRLVGYRVFRCTGFPALTCAPPAASPGK